MMIKESFTLLRASPALEVKLSGGEGIISGLASVFGGEPDSYGDVIAKGAFTKTLGRHRTDGTAPAMLWSHDPSAPTGRWLELIENEQGLAVRGQLNLQTERGRQAHEHMKAGDVTGLSIGYRVPPGGRAPNADGTWTLTEIDLMEISAVTMPAARRARVNSVKNVASQADAERALREGGFSRAAAFKIATGGWPSLLGDQDESPAIDQLIRTVAGATINLKGILK